MPKITVTYDTTKSNVDAEDYKLTLHASGMYRALIDIATTLRSHEKHGAEPLTRESFYAILNEYNINLDDL